MSLSDVLAVIGLLASAVGIPITFIVARRARQRPELRYVTDFDVLLNPSDSLFEQGLFMSLRDHEIDRISRTRVAIWNYRGDTVRGADIVATDPLRIAFNEDDGPLQARVVGASRPQVELASITFASYVLINFDFLDSADGGLIEVIHRGGESPRVCGTVRGARVIANGSANLAPEALAAKARASLRRRIILSLTEVPPRLIFALVAGGFAWVLLQSSLPLVFGGPGSRINAQRYDLNTSKGQIDFANAVTNARFYEQQTNPAITFAQAHKVLSAVGVVCVFEFVILLAISGVLKMTRKRIPTNIATYRES